MLGPVIYTCQAEETQNETNYDTFSIKCLVLSPFCYYLRDLVQAPSTEGLFNS